MYGIPENFDISAVIGQMIERVDLGPYIMHIRLSNGWTISCEGTVVCVYGGSEGSIRTREWVDLNHLKNVVGSTISEWAVVSKKAFELYLNNGGIVLRFIDDSDSYESFQISPTGAMRKGWVI